MKSCLGKKIFFIVFHSNDNVVDDDSICVLKQEKPKLIDPLDYEAVISELEPEIREDPLQDLLLFPDHDFTVSFLLLSALVYMYVCSGPSFGRFNQTKPLPSRVVIP